MNITDLFPKKWLEAADLAGRSVSVKIAAVGLEEVYDPRSRDLHMKLALTFERASKRMLLNKTQAFAVAAATGSEETDGWIGKTITLSAGVTAARRPTLVVAPPRTQAAAVPTPTPVPDTDDDPEDPDLDPDDGIDDDIVDDEPDPR